MATYASPESSKSIQNNIMEYYMYFHHQDFIERSLQPFEVMFDGILQFLNWVEEFSFIALEKRPLTTAMEENIKKIVDYLEGIDKNDAKIDYEAWRDNISNTSKSLTKALDEFHKKTDNEYSDSIWMRVLKEAVVKLSELDTKTKEIEIKDLQARKHNVNVIKEAHDNNELKEQEIIKNPVVKVIKEKDLVNGI